MNLLHITNFLKTRLYFNFYRTLLAIYVPSLLALVSILSQSCTDETLVTENPQSSSSATFAVLDLPGVFGINLSQINDGPGLTRDDNSTVTSDGNSLNDGTASEYDLIIPSAQDDNQTEFYHYLLLYDKNNSNAKPLIFPIDVDDNVLDGNRYNNLTLTIKKIITNSDDNQNLNFSQILKNYQPYVLLNFKLIDNPQNYSLDNGIIKVPEKETSTTSEKLSTLTASELEKLQIKDYKISAKKIYGNPSQKETQITYNSNFFIMSSSVYSNGSSKIVDGTIIPENFSLSEEEAKEKPALTVYVERLASKITVGFNIDQMNKAEFDFGNSGNNSNSSDNSSDNYLQDNTPSLASETVKVTYDATTGLPVINLKVRRVDMLSGNGITFNENGYTINSVPIEAKIRIMGFGVSNVETQENLFKYVKNTYDPNWNWRDVSKHRCYWAEDSHYEMEGPSVDFTRVKGYPHQYRLALDTDSVTSYHKGNYEGNTKVPYKLDYTDDPNAPEYVNYISLGTPTDETIDDVYLKYKSYNELVNDFKSVGFNKVPSGYEHDPIYALENTYVDQGMLSQANWRWPWHREPYAVASNLMLMATIEIVDNPYTDGVEGEVAKDLYLGQNNIFYLKKENFLRSKLEIFNKVMLSGGNAGLQILHGQWDRHSRWDEDDENQYKDTHLDKVAWHEGSYLWFAETEVYPKGDPNEGKPVYDQVKKIDDEGKEIVTYKVRLKKTTKLNTGDNNINITEYLDLIPAEISGGDGQRLIAPSEEYMGVKYRYYLAPEIEKTVISTDQEGNEINTTVLQMDETKAVEISFNHLVALIHKIIGPVDVYSGGRMYYSMPIPHRLKSFGPNNNANKWKEIGSFGLVRNNWYSITVDQINKLGTPVDDANQPIVPVMDVKRSYINMGVKLKDWHEIKQDNIPVM